MVNGGRREKGGEKKDWGCWDENDVWNVGVGSRIEVGLEWKGAFDSMVCW
jgi:hypothetical protein